MILANIRQSAWILHTGDSNIYPRKLEIFRVFFVYHQRQELKPYKLEKSWSSQKKCSLFNFEIFFFQVPFYPVLDADDA